MNPFQGMTTAQAFEGGTYFEIGEHDVCVKRLLAENKRKGPTFIAELTVIGSNAIAPGADRSWIRNLLPPEMAFAELLKFLAAVCGYNVSDKAHLSVINGDFRALCNVLPLFAASDANPFRQRRLHVSTVPHTTKGNPAQGKLPAQITRNIVTPLDAPIPIADLARACAQYVPAQAPVMVAPQASQGYGQANPYGAPPQGTPWQGQQAPQQAPYQAPPPAFGAPAGAPATPWQGQQAPQQAPAFGAPPQGTPWQAPR